MFNPDMYNPDNNNPNFNPDHNYLVVWTIIDEEGFPFLQSLICETLEEVTNAKHNLEMMDIVEGSVKTYSLKELEV